MILEPKRMLRSPVESERKSSPFLKETYVKMKKDRAVLVTGHEGPLRCERSRLPHFLDSRLIRVHGGKVDSLTRRPPFSLSGKFLVLISVRGSVGPRDIVRLEGLGKLKKSNELIGI
jgi:hypothetical protein